MPEKIDPKITPQKMYEMRRSGSSLGEVTEAAGVSKNTALSLMHRYAASIGENYNQMLAEDAARIEEGAQRLSLFRQRSKNDILVGNPPPGLSALDRKIADEEMQPAPPADPFALVVRNLPEGRM